MMSKRSEIHSSNIIGKKGILRSGRDFKGKGRGIVPGFRNNVSFAEEERVDDLLNASQLAQKQHCMFSGGCTKREEETEACELWGTHKEAGA